MRWCINLYWEASIENEWDSFVDTLKSLGSEKQKKFIKLLMIDIRQEPNNWLIFYGSSGLPDK